jgi:hypothetical protein
MQFQSHFMLIGNEGARFCFARPLLIQLTGSDEMPQVERLPLHPKGACFPLYSLGTG